MRRVLIVTSLVLFCIAGTASPAASTAGYANGGSIYNAHGVILSDWNVPEGIKTLQVTLVGGWGASVGAVPGGAPAKVQGVIPVTPGSSLWLISGSTPGTFNGEPWHGLGNGGSGATTDDHTVYGGGGGGSSDIRTLSPGQPGTLASRIVIAGGGGGAGSSATGTGGTPGGSGGQSALIGGAGGNGAGASPGTGGSGGGGATASGSGSSGSKGLDNAGSSNGQPGSAGSSSSGGTGGEGFSAAAGYGGGGGGGRFGGGGGGGGALTSGLGFFTGGGGGGGGSSLVPLGTSVSLAGEDDEAASVKVTYSSPGTDIKDGPVGPTSFKSPSFAFDSTAPGSTFKCSIDGGTPVPCSSPAKATGLNDGPHTFAVTATDTLGNFDPNPATSSFVVDTVHPDPPNIDSGPDGKTEEMSPEFTFSSSDPSATFECAFDTKVLRKCSGANSDRFPGVLLTGAHKFRVRATDAAGNHGFEATRNFEIVPTTALWLDKPKLDLKKGSARLPVIVSGAGKVVLAGSKSVKPFSTDAEGAQNVSIRISARGEALKRLRRSGKSKVRIQVSFTAEDGISATEKTTLTLKKKLKNKKRS